MTDSDWARFKPLTFLSSDNLPAWLRGRRRPSQLHPPTRPKADFTSRVFFRSHWNCGDSNQQPFHQTWPVAAATHLAGRVVSVEVESHESSSYWLSPVTFDNCCLSLRSLRPALTAPPSGRPLVSFASLRGVSQRRAIIPAYPSPLISQQDPALAPGFFSSTLCCYCPPPTPPIQAPAQSSPRERVYIDRTRGSHQKERRKRVRVRLNGASFLQQRRGDFIERPLQAIDRPSGMDTVKARMKSEWVREGEAGCSESCGARETQRQSAIGAIVTEKKGPQQRTGNKRRERA